jgi:two-component system response regulator AtoC
LRNVIERAVLLADGDQFPAQWLQLPGDVPAPSAAVVAPGPGVWLPLDGTVSLDAMEQRAIEAALQATGFNVAAAARLLGSTRQTLRYRIQKYGISLPE